MKKISFQKLSEAYSLQAAEVNPVIRVDRYGKLEVQEGNAFWNDFQHSVGSLRRANWKVNHKKEVNE